MWTRRKRRGGMEMADKVVEILQEEQKEIMENKGGRGQRR